MSYSRTQISQAQERCLKLFGDKPFLLCLVFLLDKPNQILSLC